LIYRQRRLWSWTD